MLIKGIIDCDLVNYKEPCLTIETPKCNFKCDKECGMPVCQNSSLASAPTFSCPIETIIDYFDANPVTQAICFQGLEPFDTFEDLLSFIQAFRVSHSQPIIIYTGYTQQELKEFLKILKQYKNIIIKFGRFIPNDNLIYNKILGVNLSSSNQYAEVIS
jgi:hypothetical protein